MAIRPEDVRNTLATGRAAAGAVATAGLSGEVREGVARSISSSYFLLRRGMAILSLLLPIALVVGAGVDHIQPSISAYYHFRDVGGGRSPYGGGEMRDVMVGVMWAIGAFLIFYRGYSWKENWALNVAGIAAVLIALFPMDWPVEQGSPANMVHFTSAILFFLATAYVCLFRSGDTLELIEDGERRRRFKRRYAVLGTLMIALPLGLFLLHLLSDRLEVIPERTDERPFVLAVEVAANWVFSLFWLVKSREIHLIQNQ